MVIDDITRHTELTMRPPEAPGVSNPFCSYVLIASVLRLLCGDKPGERERPGRRPKVKDKATATYHGLFKNRSKNTCSIAGTQACLLYTSDAADE